MENDDLKRYMPPELLEGFEPLAILKNGQDRQTLLVEDKNSGGRFVLKCVRDAPEEVIRKYRALADVAGDGIPQMYQLFRRGGAVYMLREYVPGQTLLDWTQKRGVLSAEETAVVGLAVCRALKKLHNCQPPIIHRDIKAENIIRTPEGKYALIDFGIARFYDEQESRDTQLKGTAFSAPPEQFGYRQTDPRADIYALGVLLHELSTGEYRLDRGQTPGPLRAVVKRCTRFDPEDRYGSVSEVERALRPAADGPRVRLRRAAAILGVVLALGAVTAAVLTERRAPDEAVYTFQSPAIEAEVCRQLDKDPGTVTRGDLERISSLLLCGDEPFDSWNQMDTHGTDITIDGSPRSGKGTVDTLEDLRAFPNLIELALCDARITDLSPLEGSGIRRLALHGNEIGDLSPLSRCQYLQELIISDNPVSDLSPLAACAGLQNLNAGATGIADLDGAAAIPGLQYLGVHDCPYLADTSALGSMTGLRYMSIRPVGGDTLSLIRGMKQLQHLYIWIDDSSVTDLRSLSELTGLTRLFADIRAITSLEGVQSLTELRYLDVRCSARPDAALDPEPLRGLTALEELNGCFLETEELGDILASLPALRRMSCYASQSGALRALLADRPEVEISAY